eukprot:6209467-Pleurochrysis_carterae.AAC.1
MARFDMCAPRGRGTMMGRYQRPSSSCFLPSTELARSIARVERKFSRRTVRPAFAVKTSNFRSDTRERCARKRSWSMASIDRRAARCSVGKDSSTLLMMLGTSSAALSFRRSVSLAAAPRTRFCFASA